MKIKNLLLLVAAAAVSFGAYAEDSKTVDPNHYGLERFVYDENGKAYGEYVYNDKNSGVFIGDYLFVNQGEFGITEENVVSFKNGSPQIIAFYMDDSNILADESIQKNEAYLAKMTKYDGTNPYNEITYSALQYELYYPTQFEMKQTFSYNGEKSVNKGAVNGPRGCGHTWQGQVNGTEATAVIDGIEYTHYTMTSYSGSGLHFAGEDYGNDPKVGRNAGAVGYMQMALNDESSNNGYVGDMIISRAIFSIIEDLGMNFYVRAELDAANKRRMHPFERVALYDFSDVVEGVVNEDVVATKYVNLAGVESATPFDGVNICVETMSDGSTRTHKVLK